jgi:hypothetical protein|tara:strand:+ start:738 stop:932 length:195 start_codon:yes stop_codon:yes gene_type:complete
MEERQEQARFGLLEGEVLTVCIKSSDTESCRGTLCLIYQNCWSHLNPDEEGYFNWSPSNNPYPI